MVLTASNANLVALKAVSFFAPQVRILFAISNITSHRLRARQLSKYLLQSSSKVRKFCSTIRNFFIFFS